MDDGCGWFIDNSGNIQSSNNTCILGSLPLGIIELCRNGDAGILAFLPKLFPSS